MRHMDSIQQLLEERLRHKLIRIGSSLRSPYSPCCESEHKENPALDINLDKGVFYCHACGQGGKLPKLLEERDGKVATEDLDRNEEVDPFVGDLWNSSSPIDSNSVSAKYLMGRGILWSTIEHVANHLRTFRDCENDVLIYRFTNQVGGIVALQRTFLNRASRRKIQRKYLGKKSFGVAVLKDASEVIVAEGLETGLSVFQHLNCMPGLIITGDAGGLSSLAISNSWAIEKKQKVIVAADNDLEEVGQEAAFSIYEQFPEKTFIYTPSLPGTDWNDSLVGGKIFKEWF